MGGDERPEFIRQAQSLLFAWGADNVNLHLEKDRHHFDVIDDLGMGKVKIKYNYASLLAQSNSHTIHHYAIINYILNQLKISIDDSNFGFNPTTPKLIR